MKKNDMKMSKNEGLKKSQVLDAQHPVFGIWYMVFGIREVRKKKLPEGGRKGREIRAVEQVSSGGEKLATEMALGKYEFLSSV